jgi:hypothetical protein
MLRVDRTHRTMMFRRGLVEWSPVADLLQTEQTSRALSQVSQPLARWRSIFRHPRTLSRLAATT